MKRLLLTWLFLLLANQVILAQSTPGLAPGQVPTAAQWNSYFAAKADYLGAVPLSLLGGTMQGPLITFASSAAAAGFNVPHGTAPSSPNNGDIWTTTAGLFARINGSTVGPYGTGAGGANTVPNGFTGQTTFTTNLPLIGNGTGALAQGTRTGNTTAFATFTGAATNGNCVSIDASGNLKADGAPCGAVGSVIPSANGGTGVNNGASTITIGGSLTFSGAFPFTATLTASTSPTFPAGTYTLANQTGISGGIPYYSSATTQGSSGALGVNLPVFGGGAGSAPTTGTRSGNTTEVATVSGSLTSGNSVKVDASGNLVNGGQTAILLNVLTASGSTTVSDTTSFTSAYRTYTLRFINFVAAAPSNTTACQIQINSGGFQTSGYVSSPGPTTYIPCFTSGNGAATGAAPGLNGDIIVSNPSASAKAMFTGALSSIITGGGSIGFLFTAGYWNTNAAVTGFQVFWGTLAGTPTANGIASGTIEVWGNP